MTVDAPRVNHDGRSGVFLTARAGCSALARRKRRGRSLPHADSGTALQPECSAAPGCRAAWHVATVGPVTVCAGPAGVSIASRPGTVTVTGTVTAAAADAGRHYGFGLRALLLASAGVRLPGPVTLPVAVLSNINLRDNDGALTKLDEAYYQPDADEVLTSNTGFAEGNINGIF